MKALDSKLAAFLHDSPDLWTHEVASLPSFKELLDLTTPDQALLCAQIGRELLKSYPNGPSSIVDNQKSARLLLLLTRLMRRKQAFDEDQLIVIGQAYRQLPTSYGGGPQSHFAFAIKRYINLSGGLSEALRHLCLELIEQWDSHSKEETKWARNLREAIADESDAPTLPLVRNGEVFAHALLDDFESMTEKQRAGWARLLNHAADSEAGSPSKTWLKKANDYIKALRRPVVTKSLLKWFPLIQQPAEDHPARTISYDHGYTYTLDPMTFVDPHLAVLKGLAWIAGLLDDTDVARLLGATGVSAYKKIPGTGPRATRVGNACVWALGQIGSDVALTQLASMKVKVKFGTAQQSIEKSLAKLAMRLGVPPDELEEMSVPDFGLSNAGTLELPLGDYLANLEVGGKKPSIKFRNPEGKLIKSVPTAVRQQFDEELKELRANIKDIEKMLGAQRERLDNLFLLKKSWPLALWRERYMDHPLVGTLSRRLIWTFDDGERKQNAIWLDGTLKTCDGKSLALHGDHVVSLWHPIHSRPDEVLGWRRWLFEHLVQQPFKQARREIYLLTDAERTTGVYSNRFAAHILKQHQFHSLCGVRGWKNRLRLMVDDTYPPAIKLLPEWNLRAEFWIEGMGNEYSDDYVVESGAYRYLTTDQVRFYRIGDAQMTAHAGGGSYSVESRYGTAPAPLSIDEIPSLVLTEIFRDADLFVGVTSAGNDPNWSDGGPQGHFRDYWREQAFGALGETAKTRKEILTNLLPRLKIASSAKLDGRFLHINGKLRAYKIHLGSGNILMEPNDEYLCIVRAQSLSSRNRESLFIPFEGDDKLAVILSKAFLLAADDKITDPTIVSQIKGKY